VNDRQDAVEPRGDAPTDPTTDPRKDPEDWVTGDEPMTGPQRSYLQTLSREAGVEFDEGLTKAEASRRIDELQQRTGRGAETGAGGGPGEGQSDG
jgi:hypothetical protein